MIPLKIVTKEQALQKLKHYCAYQERCHSEARQKLYSLGLRTRDVEEVISSLIEEDYLNEERFAEQYAGGKFRMNGWGRVKIVQALQQKKISTYCINKALKQINTEGYEARLLKLARVKWNSLKGEKAISRQAKTYSYLLQKGYEADQVGKAVAILRNEIDEHSE